MPKGGNPNEAQRRLMGMALSAKRGNRVNSPAASKIAHSMTTGQLRDYAKKPTRMAKRSMRRSRRK